MTDEHTLSLIDKCTACSDYGGYCPKHREQRGEIPEHLRLNIAKVIEDNIRYYKSEVGDRLSNVCWLADAVLREVSPYLRTTEPDDCPKCYDRMMEENGWSTPKPVSLAQCAAAMKKHNADKVSVTFDDFFTDCAKAVLDAARVKYV